MTTDFHFGYAVLTTENIRNLWSSVKSVLSVCLKYTNHKQKKNNKLNDL